MNSDKYNPEKDASNDNLEKKKDDKKSSSSESIGSGSEKPVDKKDTSKEEKQQKRASFFEQKKDTEPEKKPEKTEPEATTEAKPETESTEEEQPLNEVEAREAIEHIIDERDNDLAQELQESEPESAEELAAVANAAFLANLRERVEEVEDFTEEDIEIAFEQAAEELELQDDEAGELEPTAEESNEELPPPEDEAEDDPAAFPPPVTIVTPATPTPIHTPQTPQLTPTFPPPPVPPHTPPTPPLTPPSPPRTPSFPTPPPTPAHSPHSAINMPPRFVHHNQQPRRRRNDLLIGAVVGYIVGRRGGRKRTEKKLLPKIDVLEREVTTLHSAIAEREEKIRTLAHKTAHAYATKNAPAGNDTKKPRLVHDRLVVLSEKRQIRVEKTLEVKKQERIKIGAIPEKIGAMKLTKSELFLERRLLDGNESSPKRKPVEIMTVPELIEKVGGLEVAGMGVVAAYESGRLDDEALREITKRFLRSGDYTQVFQTELKTDPKEIKQRVESIEKLQVNRDAELIHTSPLHAQQAERQAQAQVSLPGSHVQQQSPFLVKPQKPDKKLVKPWVRIVMGLAIGSILLLLTQV